MGRPTRRKELLNKAIKWILSQLERMNRKMKEAAEKEKKEIVLPKYLSIKEIIVATQSNYQTLMSYSTYRELEKRFKCLEYDEQKGRWIFHHDKIEEDLEDKNDIFL